MAKARAHLTTNNIIALAKLKAMIPTNQSTITTADFLYFMNEEMRMGIVPTVLQTQEEFFVYSEDVDLVASKSSYPVPYRAIGGKLRDLFYKDSQDQLREMTRIAPEDKSYYQNAPGIQYFYFQGNNVILVPEIGTNVVGSLQFDYYLRPNNLVEESKVAEITNIATVGTDTVFTVDGIPTDFSTAKEIDILQELSGHRTINMDLFPSAINTTAKTITFPTADVSSDIIVGDIIALAGECIIPQIPTDLHPILAQRVAARCVEALGDSAGLQAANAKLAEMESKTNTLIESRATGAPMKVFNRNGLIRSGKSRRGNNW